MTQSQQHNRHIVLAQRPNGEPTDDTLSLETGALPEAVSGEMLLRTVYLSLDPYMRGRMNEGPSYAPPVAIGETMIGGTVSRVVTSSCDGFAVGDWVMSYNGWQDYAVSNGEGVINLGADPQNPSWALGVLGMPGFTAYAGLKYIGEPKAGETIVVAAATGPVGATVGQIGKLLGCRVVGIAGGPDKCRWAEDALGFDICLDHKQANLAKALADAVPEGIDVYFENVGGRVLDAVLPLLNDNARVPVCGLVAQYNATSLPDGPDRLGWLMGQMLVKKIRMQGFIIFDNFADRYPEFAKDMQAWVSKGDIKYREQIVDGLEVAPKALIGLLKGENFGKLVVRVGPDSL